MIHKLSYVSRRNEIWSWYWLNWQRSLWRFHLTVAGSASLACLAVLASRGPIVLVDFGIVLAVGFVAVAWMPLYPMMMFKPHVRTLALDEQGLSTTIGKRTGRRAWAEISAISERDGYIEIRVRNGNAFIVPPRALASAHERDEILSFAQAAWSAARGALG